MSKNNEKEFYVDFGSWHIHAKSPDEAMAKAMDMIREGEIPCIDSIGEV